MDSDTTAADITTQGAADKNAPDMSKLLQQYGCGPIPGGSHLKCLDGGILACVFGRPQFYPWPVRYGGWRKRDGRVRGLL